MTVIVVNVLGWLGMALLIGAYALVTAGRIHATGHTFQIMNLFGGGSLMINSAYYGAWPSAVLNLVWVGIGTVGLVRAAVGRPRRVPEHAAELESPQLIRDHRPWPGRCGRRRLRT